jgi:hypothetical protein
MEYYKDLNAKFKVIFLIVFACDLHPLKQEYKATGFINHVNVLLHKTMITRDQFA